MIATALGPRQRSAIVVAPEYFERYAVPQEPRDLLGLPCVRYRFAGGGLYRWEFERGGTELEIEVDGPLTLADQDLMIDAALAGTGLAYVFEGLVERYVAEGRLVRVLEGWCPYYPGFFLYYPSRRQMPAALRAFVDFIKMGEGRGARWGEMGAWLLARGGSFGARAAGRVCVARERGRCGAKEMVAANERIRMRTVRTYRVPRAIAVPRAAFTFAPGPTRRALAL